jgi:hypothetical protein
VFLLLDDKVLKELIVCYTIPSCYVISLLGTFCVGLVGHALLMTTRLNRTTVVNEHVGNSVSW